MKNGGKNKSVALIILFNIYIYILYIYIYIIFELIIKTITINNLIRK